MNNQATAPGSFAIPAGYSLAREGNRFRVIRAGREADLAGLMTTPLAELRRAPGALPAPGGRAAPVSVPVPGPGDGGRVLVRPYSHGGLLGRMRGRTFLGPERALRELSVSDAAERLGLPVPAPLGLTLERRGAGRWRMEAWLEWIPGATALSAALRDSALSPEDRTGLVRAVADAVRRAHDAGLAHFDLNSRNVLVRRESGTWRTWIVDLDRARIVPRMERRAREGRIARLLRSLAKEGAVPRSLAAPECAELARGASGGTLDGPRLDRFLARTRRAVLRHSLLWRRPFVATPR